MDSKDFAKNFLDAFAFSPNEKVNGVMCADSKIVKFDEIKSHENVVCPNCFGSVGFKIIDHEIGIIWSCRQPDCININAGRSKKTSDRRSFLKVIDSEAFRIPNGFQNAQINSIHNQSHKQICKEWCLKPRGCVLMAGGNGRGKTYASIAILEHYRKNLGQSAKFYNISDLYTIWISAVKDGLADLIFKLTDCEILVLDDLGIRTPSEGFLDFLYLIIDKRHGLRETHGTIISTNLNAQQIKEKFGEAVYSRISYGKILKFTGNDKRLEF